MSTNNPIKDQLRQERRKDRLGGNAACALCGYSKSEGLTAVTNSFLEKHHIFGKANDSKTMVSLCLNCHREVTEAARSNGAMRHASNCLERFELMLRALGSFFVVLGERMLRLADEMAGFIFGLDQSHPEWRKMPEAK